MKIKAIRKFFDRKVYKIRMIGDIFEVDENRYQEIKGFCEKENKNNNRKK